MDVDCVYIDLLVIRESFTEKWIDIDMYTPLHYEQAT